MSAADRRALSCLRGGWLQSLWGGRVGLQVLGVCGGNCVERQHAPKRPRIACELVGDHHPWFGIILEPRRSSVVPAPGPHQRAPGPSRRPGHVRRCSPPIDDVVVAIRCLRSGGVADECQRVPSTSDHRDQRQRANRHSLAGPADADLDPGRGVGVDENPQCSTSRTGNRIVRELCGSAPSVYRRNLSGSP
jgi:hypothetical protein